MSKGKRERKNFQRKDRGKEGGRRDTTRGTKSAWTHGKCEKEEATAMMAREEDKK